MEVPSDLLLSIWREVSRHVEIEESVARIAPLLWPRVPAESIGLLRFNLTHRRLDAVAMEDRRSEGPGLPRHYCIEDKDFEDLLAWGRSAVVVRTSGSGELRKVLALLHSPEHADLLVGPLADDSGVHGIFLAAACRSGTFSAEHARLLAALLEPLTVALRNDQRLTEISTLREAAEADKISLLRRLGREAITDAIVGVEGGLKPVMERVRLVAPADLPVLILGETGSGKEVIARAIHDHSPRSGGPFLRVNCGAIPPELIDSELFGHEKGSFTGATGLRKGWFERADGGTLFLDEVGELPPAAQVRLLRVLQDGTFERVGGQHTLTVAVRVIAATNSRLRAMVDEGRFRADLWYRIAVFPIELPPLRDRPEDMSAMANHFAQRAARRFGFPALTVSAKDLPLLLEYSWPGNARELAAVMDRAVILGQGKRLEIATALGMPLGPSGNLQPAENGGSKPARPPTATPQNSHPSRRLDDVAREHIERVLIATGGKIEGPAGAAKVLDINPHTLRARMRKLGIEWNKFRTGN